MQLSTILAGLSELDVQFAAAQLPTSQQVLASTAAAAAEVARVAAAEAATAAEAARAAAVAAEAETARVARVAAAEAEEAARPAVSTTALQYQVGVASGSGGVVGTAAPPAQVGATAGSSDAPADGGSAICLLSAPANVARDRTALRPVAIGAGTAGRADRGGCNRDRTPPPPTTFEGKRAALEAKRAGVPVQAAPVPAAILDDPQKKEYREGRRLKNAAEAAAKKAKIAT